MRQLSPQDNSPARERPLSKRAFIRVSGFGQKSVNEIWKQPAFPLVCGKVYWSDYVLWRRRNIQPASPPVAPSEPEICNIPHPLAKVRLSPTSLPPRAARLLALAESQLRGYST